MKVVREILIYVLTVLLFVSTLVILKNEVTIYETAYQYLTEYVAHSSIRVVQEGEE